MYDGWLTVAGVEIVNRARTTAYAAALLPTLEMKDCSDCWDLQAAIGDTEPYVSPAADEAPWYDPDTPDSDMFLGLTGVIMSGFEDSTRTANIIESTGDGGTVGRTRKATREMRVSGWLLGATQAATVAGLSWLKAVLDGNLCNVCDDSDDICFLAACPRVDQNPDDFIRHLRRVKCTSGPTVITERNLSCGGYMVQVEFTLVAGSPFVYGEPIMVAAAAGSELTPIFPGSEVFPLTQPIEPCFAAYDKAKRTTILRDPDCPPVPNAPTVPIIASACKPLSFESFSYFPIPEDIVGVKIGGGYNARPVLATKSGTWVTAYTVDPGSKNITTATVIKARVSTTSGASWGTEYTLYDEGSGTRGVTTTGMTYAADVDKFILGVNNYDFSNPGHFRGEILTSSTGLSGSWSVLTNLDAVMATYGMQWYRMGDVEHHEDGSTNGVLYASVWGVRKGQTRQVALVLRSTNMGTTWSVLSLPWFENPNNSYTYPALAVWSNGEIGVFSNIPESKQIFFKRSADGGRSWSAGTVVATAAGPSLFASPVITNDGGIMALYQDMRNPGSRNLGQGNYKYSKDRGRTWRAGSTAFVKNSTHGYVGGDWAVGVTGDLGVVFGLDYTNTDARIYWETFWQRENYFSYAIGVPDSALKAWADGVLLLQIKTGSAAARQMRVRLVPRPIDTVMPEDLDPCSICSGFIIDYAPANTVVYVDGMTERVTMSVGNGVPSPADHLVSGENGAVFEWPTFSCGTGYFVLLDTDVNTVVDVALAVVNRE